MEQHFVPRFYLAAFEDPNELALICAERPV
jgi:hypothetical protein